MHLNLSHVLVIVCPVSGNIHSLAFKNVTQKNASTTFLQKVYIFSYFCNSVWCCLGTWSYATFNNWTERKYVGKQWERFTITQDILCAIPQFIPEPSLVKFWMEFSINGIVFVWMKRFSKLRWLASPSQMQIFTQHPLPAGFSHSQPHMYRLTKHTQPVLSCSFAMGSWYNRYLSTPSSHPAIRAEHCCQQ